MPGQSSVNFRVIANQVCMYSVGLTNVGYQLVFAGVQYGIKIGKNRKDVILVYQHSGYQSEFTVGLKDKVASLVVSKVKYTFTETGQPVLMLPSITNNNYIAYTTSSSSLTIKSSEQTQYLILV